MERTQIYEKKGQAAAVNAIITLAVGLAVVTMIQIFTGVLSGQTYGLAESQIEQIGNKSITDLAFTTNNVTPAFLGYHNIHEGSLAVVNGSTTLLLDNFTIDYTAGTIVLKPESGVWNDSNFLANFTWGDGADIRTYVKDGIKSAFSAQKQNADFTPIVGLAVITAIVLMLILGFSNLGGTSYGGGRAL